MGCTSQDTGVDNKVLAENLQRELSEKNLALVQANSKIIELQENAKYSTEELRKTRLDKEDLQLVYNDLFTDAVACYYANLCSYDEWGCVESLKDIYVGYSAKELYIMESDWCDGMYRDWETYQEHDSSIGVE